MPFGNLHLFNDLGSCCIKMCQAEVYALLKKNKGKFLSTNEIAKKLKISSGSVNSNLNKLFKQGLVTKEDVIKYFGSNKWRYLK